MSKKRELTEKEGWCLVAFAVLLLVIGGCVSLDNLRFIDAAVTTAGTVVANQEQDVKGGVLYVPLVKFTDQKGVAHRIEASHGVEDPIPIGTAVPVLYLPNDPANGRVGGSFFWNLAQTLFGCGSIAFLVGALIVLGVRYRG
jgi:hypothetical protein